MAFRIRNRLLKNEAVRFGIVFFIGVLIGTFYPNKAETPAPPVPRIVRQRNAVAPENFLTVLIVSAPYNDKQRQVLRETWLQSCIRPNCIIKFSIGTKDVDIGKIKDIRRKDILPIAELKDSYFALTQKVALSLAWIANNLNSKFVIKADEDTFVNVEELMKKLENYSSDLYMGYFSGRARVKTKGQWAEPKWKLCDHYIPNARGGGYVLGQQNVEYIAQNVNRLMIWNSEDISVGAWLSPIQVNRVHSIRFDTEAKSRGCNNDYIVTHKQSEDDLRDKWSLFFKTGDICIDEVQISPGYQYNWDVPPSQCCELDKNIP